jgi:hypothetical protein
MKWLLGSDGLAPLRMDDMRLLSGIKSNLTGQLVLLSGWLVGVYERRLSYVADHRNRLFIFL